MKHADFVHLHLHSHYSLLDGAARIDDIVKTVKHHGMPAVAVTDHGNLFGALEFYQKALKEGVKPILGYEAYLAPGKRTDRKGSTDEGAYHHLTLLVRNEKGYHNLLKLATAAYQEGFYYKPRIDKELLAAHSDGLLALSGCLNGEFAKALSGDDEARAARIADEFRAIFGKDNWFLEVQNHELAEQHKVTPGTIKLGKDLGIPVVATNDSHYVKKDDAEAQDAFLCVSTGKNVSDTNRLKFGSNEFYIKSADEMKLAFRELPEAVTNTLLVAERCNLEMKFGEMHLPRFETPGGMPPHQYLTDLCKEGVRRRYPEPPDSTWKRLEFELGVIEKMGFSSYFLIVWDFIRYGRENGIPVGPGRGSAAGSLVAYSLGITNLCPLRYDLLFERFLNPGRKEMPDIDIDFCQEKRERVIQYVREKYGADRVSQIITFQTLKARAVVRDVGRVLGIPLAEVDRIAKKIPAALDMTIAKALKDEKDLAKLAEENPQIKKLFDISHRLEGLCRSASKHAAGVVIADRPLTEIVPLYVADGTVATQYGMETLGQLGLLKMDFLGLNTLTILARAVELVRETRGIEVDLDKIPLDDKLTYTMLAAGESAAVFQLESGGMRDLLMKMKPNCFEDIIAVLALFRPGPLGSGMVDTYVRCKHGTEKLQFLHPMLEPILKETNGVILYQEQVMRIANVLAGFSLTEADALRKAMGKKKKEILDKYKDQFVSGCAKNHIKETVATPIWEQMEYFAGYGFNKSHSAAYALVTYQNAFMKANYPTELMAAYMSCEMGKTEKIVEYMDECRRLTIPVLPPDVNESARDFAVGTGKIRFGLGAVKGVGDRSISAIVTSRKKVGRFTSLYHFCEETDLKSMDRGVLESLVKCGAFDSVGARRAQLAAALESAIEFGGREQEDRRVGQASLFGGFGGGGGGGGGGGTATKAQAGTGAAVDYPPLPNVPDWPEDQQLQYEKDALGFYVTGHPLAKHADTLKLFSTVLLRDLPDMADKYKGREQDGFDVTIGGMMTAVQATIIKNGPSKGQKMYKFKLRSLDGQIEGVIFPKQVEQMKEFMVENNIGFIKGKIDFRREEPSLRVNEFIGIEKAREVLTATLTIAIKAAGLEEAELEALKRVIMEHPGPCSVLLEIKLATGPRVLLRTGSKYLVAPGETFVAAVEGLFGHGCMRFARK
ncbi:MAG: DNA polymerase III subunit alpha [Planctomycetes bacterium]|nr:DNA polymerase III subunit alpha [Planctomycetota bacterium]